jgi:hypothetical protein
MVEIFIPVNTDAEKTCQVIASTGETHFLITSQHDLVGWGWNDDGLVGGGGRLYYSFWRRKTIMKNVMSIHIGAYRCAMAIDSDGTLWGWGNEKNLLLTEEAPEKPVKIMEDVSDITLGAFYAAAIKKDGSLWVWGKETIYETPHKVLDRVIAVFLLDDKTFIIRSDHSLYVLENDHEVTFEKAPVLIAENVREVSYVDENLYQVLTTDGQVFRLQGTDWSLSKEAVDDAVQRLTVKGYLKQDHTYWSWTQINGEFIPQITRHHVAHIVTSYEGSENLVVTTKGILYAKPIRDGFPMTPQLVNLTVLYFAELLVVEVLLIWILSGLSRCMNKAGRRF